MALRLLLPAAIDALSTYGPECELENVVSQAVVFVLDMSGSMKEGDKLEEAVNAAESYHEGLLNAYDGIRDGLAREKLAFGLVTFNELAHLVRPMTFNPEQFKEALKAVQNTTPIGGTFVSKGIRFCKNLLDTTPGFDVQKCVLLMDGEPYDCRPRGEDTDCGSGLCAKNGWQHYITTDQLPRLVGAKRYIDECVDITAEPGYKVETIYASETTTPTESGFKIFEALSNCDGHKVVTANITDGGEYIIGTKNNRDCPELRVLKSSQVNFLSDVIKKSAVTACPETKCKAFDGELPEGISEDISNDIYAVLDAGKWKSLECESGFEGEVKLRCEDAGYAATISGVCRHTTYCQTFAGPMPININVTLSDANSILRTGDRLALGCNSGYEGSPELICDIPGYPANISGSCRRTRKRNCVLRTSLRRLQPASPPKAP
jgi:hypothetical protein